MADGAMTGVSRGALTGELSPMTPDRANTIIDELCDDGIIDIGTDDADEAEKVIALVATKKFVKGDA